MWRQHLWRFGVYVHSFISSYRGRITATYSLFLDQHWYHLKDLLRTPVRSLLLREPNLPACHCYIHINEEKKKKEFN